MFLHYNPQSAMVSPMRYAEELPNEFKDGMKFEIVKNWKVATHCFSNGGLISGPFDNSYFNVHGKTPIREIVERAPSAELLGAGKPDNEWLAKRERCAMAIMQSMYSNSHDRWNNDDVEVEEMARFALLAADALIAALQK